MNPHREGIGITLGSILKEAGGEKKILKNIRFERDFAAENLKFVSKDPGRKIAILDIGEEEPDLKKAYDVKIIRDTKPFGTKRGAFIVQIIKKESSGTTKEPAKNYEVEEAPIEEKEKIYIPKPIERDEFTGKVYILETELPINSGGGEKVPKQESFQHFTLDQLTLETIEKVATAVELGEPCLLEGETSTSKTSSIEYLAMVTNNEMVRLNLNGQTDTSELVGKFVPNDGQLQINFEHVVRNYHNAAMVREILRRMESEETHPSPGEAKQIEDFHKFLKSHGSANNQSIAIIQRAYLEARSLSLIESQQIAQIEGLKIPEWRWQDGIDVEAKKKGQWLILDEINLAEPQILERLNPQLEKHPSITLSENGGTVIRKLDESEMELHKQGKLPNVEPLHPGFRIFATMNPANYSGRQLMSPAYKDRWTSYKYVKNSTAKEYAAMIDLMVYGEQPEVTIRGQRYESVKVEGMFPTLEKISNFRGFAAKVAKFQEALENLAREREIGRNKKEPYVFTRRGLIEFLTYLEKKTIVDRKTRKHISIIDAPEEIASRGLQYYYLDKISNREDLRKVADQLDLIGISESNWTHKFK